MEQQMSHPEQVLTSTQPTPPPAFAAAISSAGAFVDLPSELEAGLIDLASALPAWTMEGTFLAQSTIDRYSAVLAAAPLFEQTRTRLLRALGGASGGYAVVRLGNIAQALGTGEYFLRLATAILAEVAVPFQPFNRWPLWKELGTNLDADPGLSTGTGYNAFHMDLVNATRPPDFSTLLCIRPDPLGGGPSILSDARAAVSRLTQSSRALLAEAAFRYGSFYELSDVGEEYAPFPILDGEPADAGFVRFTAKMLATAPLDDPHISAARELAAEMVRGQISFTLQRGDFLIVDQHRFVHGREPLAHGQEIIAPTDRRLLLQLFLRSADIAAGPATP